MSTSEDRSRSETNAAFEITKSIMDARDDEAVARVILEKAVKIMHADRAYLARLTSEGKIEIVRSSCPDLPSGEEHRKCLEAAREAVERHEQKEAYLERPHATSQPEGTDESFPLFAVARVLADREVVRAILIIVRHVIFFDTPEQRFFKVLSLHMANGIARRYPLRYANAQAVPPPATPSAPILSEPRRPRTQRLSPAETSDLAARFAYLLGRGRAHRTILELIVRLGKVDFPVLVRGETGTGKELVARALHDASPRRKGPCITVNVAALPGTLIEEELFGHVKGAFTGATTDAPGQVRLAEGGTLFLDEFGELPREAQAKLLRLLESGKVRPIGGTKEISVDFRLIVPTNQPLKELVEQGLFRADLYYRVCQGEIVLPPLRERREDIRMLFEHFLGEEAHGKRVPEVAPETWALLQTYDWPGNVRQLKTAARNAGASGHDPVLRADLGSELALAPVRTETPEARRRRFAETLERCGGNQSEAARVLGVDRNTLANVLGLWKGKGRRPGKQGE